MTPHLLAIDPSLTASGWALFTCDSEIPRDAGVISPLGPKFSLAERLDDLQKKVLELFSELRFGEGDYLVCEGPAPLVHNPQSSLKVERVRSIFESVARIRGAKVPGRINPRTIHTELLGLRGKQLPRAEVKASARRTAESLFGSALEALGSTSNNLKKKIISQDIIDASLIGVLALSRIKLATQSGMDIHEVFNSRELARGGRNSARWSATAYRRRAQRK